MTDLITIDELITQTNSSRIHIAYLTKLGILPNAVKRKINGKLVGCYPKDSINKIIEIKNLKDQGMTYSQIGKTKSHAGLSSTSLVRDSGITRHGGFPRMTPIVQHDITIHLKPSNFGYLVLGLVIGVLVSTLNTSGLAAMNKANNLPLTESVPAPRSLGEVGESDIYLIGVDKHNLDKLDKTNINYLIQN